MRLLTVSLALLLPLSYAAIGIDMSTLASVSALECAKKSGHHFLISRIYREDGVFDSHGAESIKNAHKAGMPNVDAYVFPCITARCPPPSSQIQSLVTKMHSEGVKIGMLWLDIERSAWPADQAHNRNFILQLANQAHAMGMKVGIYSNNNNWQAIVGIGWTGVAHYPLWWANYNGHESLSGFVPFGGWHKPAIHQYHGTTTVCGLGVDLNWYPDGVEDEFTRKFLAYRNGTIKSMLE